MARRGPWLLALRPDLLTAEDRDAFTRNVRARAFAQAVANRHVSSASSIVSYHFATLLFVGDPSQYRTLLDHLDRAEGLHARLTSITRAWFSSARQSRSRGRARRISPRSARPARAACRTREVAEFLALTAAKADCGASRGGGENPARRSTRSQCEVRGGVECARRLPDESRGVCATRSAPADQAR